MTRTFLTALFAILAFLPITTAAQAELVLDTVTLQKARVLEVSNEEAHTIPGTDTLTHEQTLTAEILDAPDKGKVVTFTNDYIQLKTGDIFYLRHVSNDLEGTDFYAVSDSYRLNILLGLAVIFLILLFALGGMQGVRGLASLCGSFILIFYLLLPGILQGYSPILVSIGVSSLIIVIGSYITHGFNKTTSSAVLGMIGTVFVTGLMAYYVIHAANLSGYTSEENVYLNFNTSGGINMVGLLFGGIMIGLLGVLYDMAIGQAIAVEELFRAGKHLTRREVYARAIRIGREHIGALVNTLAIAYVGVALPLLLLMQHSATASLASTLNSEGFATEIVRILVGSIGLILTVPITTLIASYLLADTEKSDSPRHAHTHAH